MLQKAKIIIGTMAVLSLINILMNSLFLSIVVALIGFSSVSWLKK